MSRRWPFLLIYACSGLAALIDEVAWTRLVGMVMGHGGMAASTVLGAYMGGMALGALVAGRRAHAWSPARALRVYAALELGIAACALALPAALSASRPLLAALYGDDGSTPGFALARLLVCLACLAVPTAAMGATFPIAVRWFVRRADRPGSEAGSLYAANTAGAAIGALMAGFLLLPALGLQATIIVAASINGVAAASAWWLASRVPSVADSPATATRQPSHPTPQRGRGSRREDRARRPEAAMPPIGGQVGVAALTLALSGAAALAAELAWNRLLALVVGPTTYAFSAMLAIFITGLALGSALGARLSRHARQPGMWLALALASTVLSAWGASVVVNRLPLEMAAAVRGDAASWPTLLWPLLRAGAWLLPMTVALGAAFPLATTLAAGDVERTPRAIADIYSANTAGAIAGALGAGFLLLPLAGLERSVRVIALVAIAASMVAAFGARMTRRARMTSAAAALFAVTAAFATPRWDLDLLLGGAYKYAPYLASLDAESALRAGTLLWHADGRGGAVSVRRTAGVTSLAIDGKVDASNGGDMLTQKLLAHVPLLLHEAPRQALVIGLGSGVTLGAALRHPVARVDVVEISPEVVRAADYFRAENGAALSDPRSHLVIGDGRTHLMLSRRRYDVIISEPSNPWIAGMSALFTRELFEAARDHLAPGGLMCQWAHTYDMREEDLRSIVATFAVVFPGSTLWLVGEGDLLLVGGRSEVEVDPAQVERRWAQRNLAADMAGVGVGRAFSVLSLLAARPADVARYAAGAPVQTDDRLALEYSAPGAIYHSSPGGPAGQSLADASPESWPDRIGAMWHEASAADWVDRGRMLLAAESPRLAFQSFVRALALAPRDQAAIDGLVRSAPSADQIPASLTRLRAQVTADPLDVAVAIGLSRLLADVGDWDEAAKVARQAALAHPGEAAPLEQWASVLADARQVDGLSAIVEQMIRRFPDRPATAYYTGMLRLLEGRPDEAARLARQATTADPSHAQAWGLAGASLASLGRTEEAKQAFESSARANPRDPSAYANMGLVALGAGKTSEAARWFAESLIADPSYGPAREGLATALDALGENERARRLRQAR